MSKIRDLLRRLPFVSKQTMLEELDVKSVEESNFVMHSDTVGHVYLDGNFKSAVSSEMAGCINQSVKLAKSGHIVMQDPSLDLDGVIHNQALCVDTGMIMEQDIRTLEWKPALAGLGDAQVSGFKINSGLFVGKSITVGETIMFFPKQFHNNCIELVKEQAPESALTDSDFGNTWVVMTFVSVNLAWWEDVVLPSISKEADRYGINTIDMWCPAWKNGIPSDVFTIKVRWEKVNNE